jgi:hypothetical protein
MNDRSGIDEEEVGGRDGNFDPPVTSAALGRTRRARRGKDNNKATGVRTLLSGSSADALISAGYPRTLGPRGWPPPPRGGAAALGGGAPAVLLRGTRHPRLPGVLAGEGRHRAQHLLHARGTGRAYRCRARLPPQALVLMLALGHHPGVALRPRWLLPRPPHSDILEYDISARES